MVYAQTESVLEIETHIKKKNNTQRPPPKTHCLVYFAVPADHRVKMKESENVTSCWILPEN